MASLTKLNVARHQLGTALDIFIRDRDPIAVQCLACGGGELIDSIASSHNIPTLSTHMLETVPDLDISKLRNLQRQYWNAFKHMNDIRAARHADWPATYPVLDTAKIGAKTERGYTDEDVFCRHCRRHAVANDIERDGRDQSRRGRNVVRLLD